MHSTELAIARMSGTDQKRGHKTPTKIKNQAKSLFIDPFRDPLSDQWCIPALLERFWPIHWYTQSAVLYLESQRGDHKMTITIRCVPTAIRRNLFADWTPRTPPCQQA